MIDYIELMLTGVCNVEQCRTACCVLMLSAGMGWDSILIGTDSLILHSPNFIFFVNRIDKMCN